MVRIELTQGYTAIVDDCDADLAEFNWCADVKKNGTVYAVRRSGNTTASLHRVILSRKEKRPIPQNLDTDHADGNGLNNTRANLRLATRSQNNANGRKKPNTTSRYRGVSWDTESKKWEAGLQIQGRTRYLGQFPTEEAAARAYNRAARERWGDFARLNDV